MEHWTQPRAHALLEGFREGRRSADISWTGPGAVSSAAFWRAAINDRQYTLVVNLSPTCIYVRSVRALSKPKRENK